MGGGDHEEEGLVGGLVFFHKADGQIGFAIGFVVGRDDLFGFIAIVPTSFETRGMEN